MKLIFKTGGWMVISGTIYFCAGVINDCPWQSALIAAVAATATKIPAYPVWEVVFEKLWKKRSCTKVPVEPILVGEAI